MDMNNSIAGAVFFAAGASTCSASPISRCQVPGPTRRCLRPSTPATQHPHELEGGVGHRKCRRRLFARNRGLTVLCEPSPAGCMAVWLSGCSIPRTMCIRSLDDPLLPSSSRLTGFPRLLIGQWSCSTATDWWLKGSNRLHIPSTRFRSSSHPAELENALGPQNAQ